MLKMLTDDICNTGESFTRNGKDVFYMDSQGFYPFNLNDATSPEAIWTSQGAACLSEPRLQSEDPCTSARIAAACPAKPRCEPHLPNWTGIGYGYSANNGRNIVHNQRPNWPQCDLPPPKLRGALELGEPVGRGTL